MLRADEDPIQIVPYDRTYARADFDCGEVSVNRWLQENATQSDKRGTTRTFLAVRDGVVLGYYCTKTYELTPDEHAATFGLGSSKYPVPAVLIAQLGVTKAESGTGLGTRLLVNALQRILGVSFDVGFQLVIVDALSLDVSAFYRKLGFQPFVDHPLRLFMTVANLRATFEAAE